MLRAKSAVFLGISLWLFTALMARTVESSSLPRVSVQGQRLNDDVGRQVILRGVNAGGRSKLPPFNPFEVSPDYETALNRYADAIADLGFNLVRLLVMYEAAEPVRGHYDEEYLARYDRLVQAFSRRGIYVIVDAHQDLFSRRFYGDGFPDWALREKDRDRKQRADSKMWMPRYFTGPVARSFDRFWSDTEGVQESYAEFFGMLARRYAQEPAVIGFEPMNEPFVGYWGTLHYSKWYEERLYPFYEKVAQAVHAADPRFLIFADICPVENPGLWNSQRPRPKIDNLVFSPHYYNLGTYGTPRPPEKERAVMRQGLRKHQAQAQFWDTPMVVTEYGVSPLRRNAQAYIASLYAVFDEMQLSGAFWEASFSPIVINHEDTSLFDPDGSVRPGTPYLDRPYPRAVAGAIQAFSFQPESGRFELSWKEGGASGPTVIYLPRRVYPQEPQVQMEPGGKFRWDPGTRTLNLDPLEPGADRRVVITP